RRTSSITRVDTVGTVASIVLSLPSSSVLLTSDFRLQTSDFRLQAFYCHRNAHSAADAQRRDAVSESARLQRVEQRRQDPGTARPNRMAERNRAAVHVHFLRIDAQLARDGPPLRGGRLLQLAYT